MLFSALLPYQDQLVQNVVSGVDHFTLWVHDRLVEVESIQVKGQDWNNLLRWTRYHNICTGKMRKKWSERELLNELRIGRSDDRSGTCDDVVGLFFLTELVTVVLRFVLSVVSRTSEEVTNFQIAEEQRSTEYPATTPTCGTDLYKDVVFCWNTNM